METAKKKNPNLELLPFRARLFRLGPESWRSFQSNWLDFMIRNTLIICLFTHQCPFPSLKWFVLCRARNIILKHNLQKNPLEKKKKARADSEPFEGERKVGNVSGAEGSHSGDSGLKTKSKYCICMGWIFCIWRLLAFRARSSFCPFFLPFVRCYPYLSLSPLPCSCLFFVLIFFHTKTYCRSPSPPHSTMAVNLHKNLKAHHVEIPGVVIIQ